MDFNLGLQKEKYLKLSGEIKFKNHKNQFVKALFGNTNGIFKEQPGKY